MLLLTLIMGDYGRVPLPRKLSLSSCRCAAVVMEPVHEHQGSLKLALRLNRNIVTSPSLLESTAHTTPPSYMEVSPKWIRLQRLSSLALVFTTVLCAWDGAALSASTTGMEAGVAHSRLQPVTGYAPFLS